ncbi:presenilin-like protein At1g08700 [Phoenix dactylifera]|uniref:Presenilin-like protein At1g08700 n=1 Tax=Phoenix dactylifera TaxID=42345 RepID=A0A8B7BKJ9_PHODC|nr:presenilin-like protein At1g08700 [Phoenix dactylifera]
MNCPRRRPILLRQSHTVSLGVIVAAWLTKLPKWTTWSLLLALAVLSYRGPLRILVDLASYRDDDLPAFIYEARPAVASSRPPLPLPSDIELFDTTRGIRLGLGDFCLLQRSCGQGGYDLMTVHACYLAIISGLRCTLIVLSMGLGADFFFVVLFHMSQISSCLSALFVPKISSQLGSSVPKGNDSAGGCIA